MAEYELKFMFDFGSGVCVWSNNEAANLKYGYAVESEKLPVSKKLAEELNYLIAKYDEAIDWNCPQNGLLWNKEEKEQFIKAAKNAYNRLCKELGTNYHLKIMNNFLI